MNCKCTVCTGELYLRKRCKIKFIFNRPACSRYLQCSCECEYLSLDYREGERKSERERRRGKGESLYFSSIFVETDIQSRIFNKSTEGV